MRKDMQPVDSIIFDMDGTLWDAVDSYAEIWNVTLDQEGIPHQKVTRQDLLDLMGSYLDDIIRDLLPGDIDRRSLLDRVMKNEAAMMPELGGRLYPDVKDVLKKLAEKYKLFMVSNCGVQGLENFVAYNHLEGLFVDLLSHGSTGRSKTDNILNLVKKYDLHTPVYVGDTQNDANSAHAAGVPFVWCKYGFGKVTDSDAAIDSFAELPEAIASLSKSPGTSKETSEQDRSVDNQEVFNLLPAEELDDKLTRIRQQMEAAGLDSVFIADNANKYYLTGRVFSGFIFIGRNYVRWFVRRPAHFTGPDVVTIRKVENVADYLSPELIGVVGFELNQISYADIERYCKALGSPQFLNADPLLMKVRSVKTPREVSLIRKSSEKLSAVYSKIPEMFRPGMTDVDLQIEIERESRLQGCLGIFRISGQEMELNMGSVLVGDNSDTPSPYDFAMGGGGADPSLPVGADGTHIRPGNTVMVDTNGDFTGYMTDMTRTFACGEVCDEALRAHQLSIDICQRLAELGRPGVKASDLYNEAVKMATEAGLQDRFMGHRSQAGFVGHGVGIIINELPVLAPRSRDVLELNNVIAIEPKFVIEGAGAVGVENTYVVTANGMERLTLAPQEMLKLGK